MYWLYHMLLISFGLLCYYYPGVHLFFCFVFFICILTRQKQQIMQLHARIRENELRAQQVLQNQRGRCEDSYVLKTKVQYIQTYDEGLLCDCVELCAKDVASWHIVFLFRRALWTALHHLYTVHRLHCAARTVSWHEDWPQPSSRSFTSRSSSSRTLRNIQRTSRSWRRRSAVFYTPFTCYRASN